MSDIVLDPPGLCGPRSELSRQVAKEIYKRLGEIEEKAFRAGMLEQNEKAEEYEWCRLVGMLIEDLFLAHHN